MRLLPCFLLLSLLHASRAQESELCQEFDCALLGLNVADAQASVIVKQTSRDRPHPSTMEIEVELPDSSQKVLISLNRTDAFNNVPLTVMENGVSQTFSANQVHHPSHSHYRDIDTKSVISVRHVNGKRRISGHVMHEGTSYFLEPVGESKHRITKKADSVAKQVDGAKLQRLVNRRKRQAVSSEVTTNVVEILLLIDHTVWRNLRAIYADDSTTLTELHYYYTHILNGIDTTFRNIGSDLSISVVCTGITVSKTAEGDLWMPPFGSANYDQAGTILDFIKAYSVGKGADHVMAFTRTDIKSGTTNEVSGMAFTRAACTDFRQSISEDKGLHSWNTAAHELAHNLGSEHDGDGNSCNPASKNIMAKSGSYDLTDVANSYRFSSCSVNYMIKYISSLGSTSCLLTQTGTQNTALASTVRAGARMTLDQVCKMSYPSGSGKFFFSDDIVANPAKICAQIHCLSSSNRGVTMGWLRAPVGTPCGNQKSCNWNGACVADSAAPVADENCFWGDTYDAYTCNGWASYINYQRQSSNSAGAKASCESVQRACCKTMNTLCAF